MAGNNLKILNTGLDHCYLNGLPIVEAEIDIDEIYKKVGRISSLAVQADPWFNNHTNAQKLFSESHGQGDRITRDFLDEGAKELRSMFGPYQRLIPEGAYDTKPVTYEFTGEQSDFLWNNPDPTSIFVNSVEVKCTNVYGDITYKVDGIELGTISLPDSENPVDEYLAYDLAGFLGGVATYLNYTDVQNIRNNNIAQVIELLVSNNSLNFTFDVKINAVQYNAIGWIKALIEVGDVNLPSMRDDVRISRLIKEFTWTNDNLVKVTGATLKHRCGSAYATIIFNGENSGSEKFLERNTVGDDYFGITEDITDIKIELREPTDDFEYDLIINTEIPNALPSPRFEFDSNWNPGKIIFRYQNMDTRTNKLNYTSETLKDIRIDPNIFEEVVKYLNDSLKNYVLKELYLAVGYDKKANEYFRKYEQSRQDAKFWLRSEKGLQTQYTYGV